MLKELTRPFSESYIYRIIPFTKKKSDYPMLPFHTTPLQLLIPLIMEF